MTAPAIASIASIHLPGAAIDAESTDRPWEEHFRMAIVLSALGFAAAVFWNLMAGAALGAVALFVVLRPLFLKQNG